MFGGLALSNRVILKCSSERLKAIHGVRNNALVGAQSDKFSVANELVTLSGNGFINEGLPL